MLVGCRHVGAAWAAIGLLVLATGIAAGLGDLARVGGFALIAFGALRLAMASDEFGRAFDILVMRRATPKGPVAPARAFWQRPAPYVLLPLSFFVVFVGRVLMRPPVGKDAWLLLLGIMVGALGLTVVYLFLLAAETAHAAASAAAAPEANGGLPRGAVDSIPAMAALDTTQFTREVLDVDRRPEPRRS
jgi:hypothetical protein